MEYFLGFLKNTVNSGYFSCQHTAILSYFCVCVAYYFVQSNKQWNIVSNSWLADSYWFETLTEEHRKIDINLTKSVMGISTKRDPFPASYDTKSKSNKSFIYFFKSFLKQNLLLVNWKNQTRLFNKIIFSPGNSLNNNFCIYKSWLFSLSSSKNRKKKERS